MKFATATILALANGITAMPWSSSKAKAVIPATNEDFTVRIKIDSPAHTPIHKQKIHPSMFEICLAVCWQETPTCPDGWYSNNFGSADEPCWTCCRAPEDL